MSASGDDDFSTGASLSISIEQRSLSAARQEIERELADIPVGIDATVTGGRGAVGNRSPEPANIDLARRQLGHLEALEELAIERNRFLDDGSGGGGGGGLLAGGALFRAGQATAGGGAGGALLGGGALGGGALLGGGLAGVLGIGRLLTDPQAARQGQQVPGGRSRDVEVPDLQLGLPEEWPPELRVPEGFPPELQLPGEFPPRLQTPPGFPPEIQTPPDFPPELPNIGIDVPSELQALAGGIDVALDDLQISVDANIPDFEAIVRRWIDDEIDDLEDRIQRQFGVRLDLNG